MITLTLPKAPKTPDWTQPPSQWLPSAKDITQGLMAAARAPEPKGLIEVFERRGAPVEGMIATPMSARATLLGAKRGHAFYHHELRVRLPIPGCISPDIPVWDGADALPEWRGGILAEPKYFSFFQEAPLTAFNPNHREKWRPHECLHGAMPFFWSPTMTPFEFYMGARLNEMLPVVHWYALDEALRPRCPEHTGPTRETCPRCEALIIPYWDHPKPWLAAAEGRAQEALSQGLIHLETEWLATLKERKSGRMIPTPRGYLDAARDSAGYLQSHWNRVTSFGFGAWIEHFMVEGEDYITSIDDALQETAGLTAALLSGDITLDPTIEGPRRARRALQDIAYRLTSALEWAFEGDESRGEALYEACLPAMAQAGALCGDILNNPARADAIPEAIQSLESELLNLAPYLPEAARPGLLALGWSWPDTLPLTGKDPGVLGDMALDQLVEGISSALPETAGNLEDLEEIAADLHRHGVFHVSATLGERLAAYLVGEGAEESLGDLAALEATLAAPPRQDGDADLFGTLPDSIEDCLAPGARLRTHGTLRQINVSPTVGALLLDLPEGGPIAAIIVQGAPRILSLEEEHQQVLEHIDSAQNQTLSLECIDTSALFFLIQNRFIVFTPPIKPTP